MNQGIPTGVQTQNEPRDPLLGGVAQACGLAWPLTLMACLGVWAGCPGPTMVKNPGNQLPNSAFAPVNESEGIGLLRFSTQGKRHHVAKRRETAYRKMHAACGGAYEIVDEGPWRAQSQRQNEPEPFDADWYIKFRCLTEAAEPDAGVEPTGGSSAETPSPGDPSGNPSTVEPAPDSSGEKTSP